MTSGPFPPTFPSLGHDQLVAQHIEDFEAQMAAAKALLPADEPPAYSSSSNDNNTSVPSSSQPFSAVSSSDSNNNNNNPPLQAGRVWSSESVVSFNNLCLKNAVANAFEYEQVQDSPQPGWAVRLTFSFFSGAIGGADDDNATADGNNGSFVVSLSGPYGSKKEAKAAAAESGLQVLLEAIEKRGAASKRKMPSGAGEGGEVREAASQGGPWDEDEEVENWVGLLGGEFLSLTPLSVTVMVMFGPVGCSSSQSTVRPRASRVPCSRNSAWAPTTRWSASCRRTAAPCLTGRRHSQRPSAAATSCSTTRRRPRLTPRARRCAGCAPPAACPRRAIQPRRR